MISVIITSFKEEKTIGKAIESVYANKIKDKFEVLVGAPDAPTLKAASSYKKKYKNLRVFKDSGRGKSPALNMLVKKARGDILVLTDGDVNMSSSALQEILKPFKDNKIGAVSGRPVSTNSKDKKFGFWAYMLTEIAHQRRIYSLSKDKKFFCSGYLFAIRKEIFPSLPGELLSEDGYISHMVYKSGYTVSYTPRAEVYVKYPDNLSDWIKQKKRSAGGYNQIKKMLGIRMRSFFSESAGAISFLQFVNQPIHLYWLVSLFISRIYLWYVIYRDINIKKKSHKEIWLRVDSTK